MTTFLKCNKNHRSKNSNILTVSLLMPYKKAQRIENEYMRTFPENLKNELKYSWKLFTHSDLVYSFIRNKEIESALIKPAIINLNIDYSSLDLNALSIQNVEITSKKSKIKQFFNLKVVIEVTIILFDHAPISKIVNQLETNQSQKPSIRNFVLIHGGKA